MVWSGCWLCFFMSYLGWFCNVSAWLNWIALSRIPFPECFLLENIFGQDLEGRNEATAISVRECLGYPTSESHALSHVLKLCQGGWAESEFPALVTCLRIIKLSAWGEHGLPLQAPSPFWWIFYWSPYCAFLLKIGGASNRLKGVLIMPTSFLGWRILGKVAHFLLRHFCNPRSTGRSALCQERRGLVTYRPPPPKNVSSYSFA